MLPAVLTAWALPAWDLPAALPSRPLPCALPDWTLPARLLAVGVLVGDGAAVRPPPLWGGVRGALAFGALFTSLDCSMLDSVLPTLALRDIGHEHGRQDAGVGREPAATAHTLPLGSGPWEA